MSHTILSLVLLATLTLGWVGQATAAPFAYITNSGDGTVSVIDTATNTVTASVFVSPSAWGVAVSPNGAKVYVSAFNKVYVLDTATNTVTASVTVEPGGSVASLAVSPDGARVYVQGWTFGVGTAVSVIDTATNTVMARVPTLDYPAPANGIDVSPDGARVYSTTDAYGGSFVSVLDTATNTVTATIPIGGGGDALAVSPDGKRVYVGGLTIDTATNTVIASVSVPNGNKSLAVSPDGARVYMVNFWADTVSVIDTTTNTVTAVVPVGQTPEGVAVTPDGTRVYVANNHDNTVSVIDTATNTVTATVPVGAGPLAIGQFIGPEMPDDGFTPADLTGTWYFQVFGESTVVNSPGWTAGTMILDATGAVTGGAYVMDNGATGTVTGGALTINSAGQVAGSVTTSSGATESLPHGKLDASKTVLTLVNTDVPNGRGLFVALKGGGTFAQADLAGTWYFQVVGDGTVVNGPGWTAGTMILDATGAVTGGAYVMDNGATGTVTGGALTINSAGQVAGSVTTSSGATESLPHGKLDASKTVLTLVNTDVPNGRGLFVALKGGGTFAQADLAGTWYFQVLEDSTTANSPIWASGTMTVDATGAVTGGAYVKDNGATDTLTGGQLTMDSAGQVAGSMTHSGATESLPHGKLDPSKSVLSLVNSTAAWNGRGLFVALKGGRPGTFSLTVAKAGTGTGTVTSTPAGIDCGSTCSAPFDTNASVTLTATPATGSTFAGWSGDADCSDGAVTMTGPRACTATFTLATYPLTITKAGTGTGTVTSSPTGINCGSTCTASFTYGASVTLTATPSTGSTFAGWSGDADCSDGAVTMTGPRACTATFTLATYPLTITKAGTGSGTVTSSPSGIDCGSTCSAPFAYNTSVTLTATASTGSTFAGWSGDADCSDGAVTMTGPRSCTATFTLVPPPQYSLTVTKAGSGSGTVTSSPTGITCGSTCSAAFAYNTSVTLTATASTGSTFAGWSGDADCSDGAVTMTGARSCTATFTLAATPAAGKIVLADDDWTLSDTGFAAPNNPGQFATNVAAWFTGGRPGKFHAYSDHFGLTGTSLAAAMTAAGHTWTTGTAGFAFDLPTLRQYDGIFLLVAPADTNVLIDYVESGGNVYLAYSGDGSGLDTQYNAFVAHFGLGLGTINNGIAGNVAISSPHPIFAGVTSLYNVNGSDIVDQAPADPRQVVLVSQNGHGLYAVYDASGTFTPADLAGTWYFQVFGDGTVVNSPGWTAGTMTVDATGAVTGGAYVMDNGTTNTLTGGALTINSAGQVAGSVTHSGITESLPHGKLDASKTVLTLVNTTTAWNGRGLFVALKGGGTFAPADLAGTWYFQVFEDSTTANSPIWASGTMTVDATGAVTGGSLVNDSGATDPLTGGQLTINSAGQVAGSVTHSGITESLPHGKLDASKTVLTLVNTTTAWNGRGLFVALKGGGTFAPADLAGTWYFQVFEDSTTANSPIWASGTMTVDATGAVTGGSLVNDSGATDPLTGGQLTINSAGQVAGSMTHSGITESLPHGKLDASKNVLTLVNTTPAWNGRGLFVALRGGTGVAPLFTVAKAGTGTGTVTSTPAGIDCGSTCSAPFDTNASVTLTATPATGSTFTGWSGGGCSGTSTCTVTLSATTTVTATFTLNPAKGLLLTPAAGSTLPGSTATFTWTAGTSVSEFMLQIGRTPTGTEVYYQSQGTNTSATLSGLPTDGSTLYVSLWSKLGTTWQSDTRMVTAATVTPVKADLTTPTPGTQLSGSSVTFGWNTGTSVSQYYLEVGSTLGGTNYFGQSVGTNLSATVSTLPTNGSTVYVRLWSLLGSRWAYSDYTYTAAGITPVKADLTTPTPGTQLSGSSVTFGWNTGTSVSQYYLEVGSTLGGTNYFGQSVGTNLSATVSTLPTNGSTVYVRLWSLLGSRWAYSDYTYTAAGITPVKADLTTPTPGTQLSGSSVTFGWNTGTGVSEYYLEVGNAPYDTAYYGQSVGTALAATVPTLPTDGRKLNVRLWSKLGARWAFTDYPYTAGGTGGTPATLTTPAPGSTLAGSTVTFSWTAGTGVSEYYLEVGNAPYDTAYYGQSVGTALAATVPTLPTDGRKLNVRLWSKLGARWAFTDYPYTAGGTGGTPATLTTPAPGSTLAGSTVTFSWTAGTGVSEYYLEVGNAPYDTAYYGQSVGTALAATVPTLPTDGRKLNVRLWSKLGARWAFTDYPYTAANITPTPGVLTTPTPGSTLTGSFVTFGWTAGTGVSEYYLEVGTTLGGTTLYGQSAGTSLTATVTGLPTNGSTLYVRLWSKLGARWAYGDYTYTAAGIPYILSDDFNGNNGDPVNSSIWHIPTWTSPIDGTYVDRTQFRCTQNASLPTINHGNAIIELQTYNPTGFSFYGTDLISNAWVTVDQGMIHVTVRAKMDPAPGGIVGGIFLYALKPDTTLHDEIDFELLTNRPEGVQTNIYGNEPLGAGHTQFVPYTSGTITDYHTYEIKWEANQVLWLVDGNLVRTATSNVPTGPMKFHLNLWAPDSGWLEAYDGNLQPTASASSNQVFSMSVDSVDISH